jgi:O-antigen/teichoic acid export membrane protein
MAHAPEGRADLEVAYVRSVKFFLIMGLPVTILFAGFSHVLIAVMLGPKYYAATEAMRWMGLAFLPFFVSDPMPFLLTALDEQRFLMWSTVTALIVRVALNFALIPALGFVGPCVAFFISEVLLLGLMVTGLARCGFALPLLQTSWKPLASAGCMLLVVWACRDCRAALALPAALGALAVYGVALWKLGTLSADEVALAREGSGFLKPFLAKWLGQPQHTAV